MLQECPCTDRIYKKINHIYTSRVSNTCPPLVCIWDCEYVVTLCKIRHLLGVCLCVCDKNFIGKWCFQGTISDAEGCGSAISALLNVTVDAQTISSKEREKAYMTGT